MQLGFVGLGKMGGNMVHRIHRDSDHQVVAFDFSDEAVSEAEGHGATGASSLEDLVSKLEAPRTVWVMVPSGDPTEKTVADLGELLDEGDTIVDGGNSNWHDDVRRASELDAAVEELRVAVRDKTKATTTFGYGPRFLHSTGQLHKGGPKTGVFLQLVHDGDEDVEIPGAGYTFGTLKNAQATGDLQTLRTHGLPAERIRLEGDPAEALESLTEKIKEML